LDKDSGFGVQGEKPVRLKRGRSKASAGFLGTGDRINKPVDLFKVLIGGKQLSAVLHGLCSYSYVIGGNGCSLLLELNGDTGIPIRGNGSHLHQLNGFVVQKSV